MVAVVGSSADLWRLAFLLFDMACWGFTWLVIPEIHILEVSAATAYSVVRSQRGTCKLVQFQEDALRRPVFLCPSNDNSVFLLGPFGILRGRLCSFSKGRSKHDAAIQFLIGLVRD
jgi:hypothetical protein